VTTDEFRRNRDNFCYRHPDRQSFVLCQRCLRTICPECQTQGAVGVICPECMAEQRRAESPAQKRAARRWSSRPGPVAVTNRRPIVTYAIVALTVLAFVIGLIPGVGVPVQGALLFNSAYVEPGFIGGFQPWRLLTVMLVHANFLHIGLNMLALFMLGRVLEPLLGSTRFLVLYLVSGLGGSVAVALLQPGVTVVGASGGIFGLFGALLVIGRHIGADIRGIAIVIGINFAFPFVIAIIGAIGSGSILDALWNMQISWQAHLGGLIAGAAVGFVYARTRTLARRPLQVVLLIVLVLVLGGLLAIPPILYG
jgi:membrane associated rhomboid family serine protease